MSSDHIVIVARNTETGEVRLPLGDLTLYSTERIDDFVREVAATFDPAWVVAAYLPTTQFVIGTKPGEPPESTSDEDTDYAGRKPPDYVGRVTSDPPGIVAAAYVDGCDVMLLDIEGATRTHWNFPLDRVTFADENN